MTDLIDRRVLGAVRFVDAATATGVVEGLSVQSAQAALRRNFSGLWVIWNAAGLEAHTVAFVAAPPTPALGSIAVQISVSDAARRYLPRNATIHLPLDPVQAIDVKLYRAPSSAISPGWAVIRAHVKNAATNNPLPGALLRVVRTADKVVLARGMSDERGEALVVVPGIPVTTFNSGAGPALTTEVDVTVEAIFDPAAGAVGDPDSVEAQAGLPTASAPQKLVARQEFTMELAVTVP
jgi:hypothetical protein